MKMDFLKSAVASAISKGTGFPYALGDKVDIGVSAEDSVWELYNGTKRVMLSIFSKPFFSFFLSFKEMEYSPHTYCRLYTHELEL